MTGFEIWSMPTYNYDCGSIDNCVWCRTASAFFQKSLQVSVSCFKEITFHNADENVLKLWTIKNIERSKIKKDATLNMSNQLKNVLPEKITTRWNPTHL